MRSPTLHTKCLRQLQRENTGVSRAFYSGKIILSTGSCETIYRDIFIGDVRHAEDSTERIAGGCKSYPSTSDSIGLDFVNTAFKECGILFRSVSPVGDEGEVTDFCIQII